MAIEKVDYEFQPTLWHLEEAVDDVEDAIVSPEEARRRSMAAQMALGSMSVLPKWYEEYYKLVDGGWPWRVAAYIAWAASPRNARWPDTQEKLAMDVLGLTSDRQIATWRRRNKNIANMISALQVAPMLQHRADVIEALIVSAKNAHYKSHQDRKLFLEITGDYIPTSKLVAQLKRSAGDGVASESDDVLTQYADLDDNDDSKK